MTPANTPQVSKYEVATELNFQFLKMRTFSRGLSDFSEWMMNQIIDTAKTNPVTMLSMLVHPRTGPLSRNRMIEAIAANISHVPFQSNGFFSGFVSGLGITARARIIAAIPIGTLIRKIQCQERNAVRSPPSGGPNVKAIPPVVAITPIPRPRFPSGRKRVIRSGAAAAIIDAPSP